MARKSSIDKKSPGARAHILKRLRENRLTLDELLDDLRKQFPDEEPPSRSSLGRFAKSIDEIVAHEREMAACAEALVSELGEDFDAKSGALLAQAVTTLTSKYAIGKIQSGEEMEIGDVLDLARAAKAAQESRSLSLKERREVERLAREKLLAEQAEALKASGKELGVTDEAMRRIREKLGIV